ncbi:type VI secretion system contractile sheath domain-containing protein [Litoribacillus peritrichatus]|uniref:Type VI secretion system contractile sheath large subunit n=1 Tax=Litoribacillus peritrichatus TaxID=718191 RepID=A0ABP7MLR9_9GAMM
MFGENWQQQFNDLALAQGDQTTLLQALELLRQLDPTALQSVDAFRSFVIRSIALLDKQLSKQVSVIIQNDEFSGLEARWRNLHSLVSLPVNYRRILVKLLDVSWVEISRDLNNANTINRSTLYNFIGNKELNTQGGLPFGLMVIDHYVSVDMGYDDEFDDLFTLELVGSLGKLCLCPFVMAPATEFFGETGADWLSDIKRVEKILDGPDYQGWQRLRAHPEARYIGLAMPRVKLRDSYQDCRIGFLFNEVADAKSKALTGLWGSAAFAFASIVIREFNRLCWFGFLKSRWQNLYQGAVINLPPSSLARATSGHLHLVSPDPEVRLFGNLSTFYAKQGFIPLAKSALTDKYYFANNNSIWRSSHSDDDKVIAQLQTTLLACRIAHYLKVQIRSMIGNFSTASECELFLNQWLDNYAGNVVGDDDQILSKFPLRKASVEVKEVAGELGVYTSEVVLQPQYQFDHFAGEIVLSTDLGKAS